MTFWSGAALLVLTLTSAGVSWTLLFAMARGDFERDDADGRRRARRRGRTGLLVFLIAIPLAAALWLVGSPSDAWWVASSAIVLVAAILTAYKLAVRRSEVP